LPTIEVMSQVRILIAGHERFLVTRPERDVARTVPTGTAIVIDSADGPDHRIAPGFSSFSALPSRA
jgi:hypothetical protein